MKFTEPEYTSGKGGSGTIMESTEVEEEYREYEQCGCEIGFGRYKTKRFVIKILNRLNNSKCVLFFLCLGVFCQGMIVNGIISIVISTLEKRFGLRSWETGLIAGCYDIGVCVALPIVTYVGGRGHRPLWLGWGVFIVGLGSIVFSLPHFIAPTYSVSDIESTLCEDLSQLSDCGEASLRSYRGFFIVSQILHGIGASPLFTLAITYLDANVKQCHSSIYHGIFFACSLLGPGVGFLLGGHLLTYFTNVGENVNITQSSPLWVGNWWVGFLASGSFAILVSIPIIMYPRQLPGTDQVRLDREKEMHSNSSSLIIKGDDNFGKSIRDFPRCTMILLKIPTLVFLSLAAAMDSGIVVSLATFGPKYIEEMFSLSASEAAIKFGITTIATACTAQVLGGLIVYKLKLGVVRMLKFCIIASSTALVLFFIFLITCENQDVAGVNIPYNGENNISCYSACGCSTPLFNPVCGSDGLTYLSYCDAGCELSDTKYVNCTRVFDSSSITWSQNATAVSERCDHATSCPSESVFLVVAGLAVFLTFLKQQPGLQASLRSVPFAQRSFSMGIQWLFIRICGSIPIPIIFGNVLDISCMVWGEQCGECGSCKIYDNYNLSRYITTLIIVAKGFSVIFLALAIKTYRRLPDSFADETSQTNGTSPATETTENTIEMNEHDDTTGKELGVNDATKSSISLPMATVEN